METILHRLFQWAKDDPGAPAQRYKEKGAWKALTTKEYCDRVYHLALFLQSRGMSLQDTSVIFSINCPAWTHVDLGSVLLGMKSAGIYPNSNPKDTQYILEHTRASVLSVQDKDFFNRISGGDSRYAIPDHVRLIIVFDGDTSIDPRAVAYEAALEEGRRIAQSPEKKKISEYLSAIDPDAGLIMIYTSGTTGTPKGALLSLDNFTFTADIASRFWDLPRGDGELFSFLPLCHVAEKIHSIGVGLSQRYTVSFCTRIENVSLELPEVQPTLLLSVPRLWEKMMEGVVDRVEKAQGLQKKLAQWALNVGGRVAEARYSGRSPQPLDLVQYRLADQLVLRKIRKAMGLGRAQKLASGAAALPPYVSKWFRRIGLEILEDFGQTESTGVICMTETGKDQAGTVGKPVPGIDVKIAEDGELLTRGRHVFKGYFKDEASTRAALEGGWLHTGDLVELTEQGLIRVRGRKKEIMKTSGGKMIAPGPLEETLKASPAIGNVCLVGDGRKYITALVTLSEPRHAELKAKGVDLSRRVLEDGDTLTEIRKAIDQLNHRLASYEQVKKFTVLTREFSVAEGEMTPTLKMKRNVVEQRYRDLIDRMYE